MSFEKITCAEDLNLLLCKSFDVLKARTMRFYNLDGIEENVKEPKYHIDEDELLKQFEAIEELLTYV